MIAKVWNFRPRCPRGESRRRASRRRGFRPRRREFSIDRLERVVRGRVRRLTDRREQTLRARRRRNAVVVQHARDTFRPHRRDVNALIGDRQSPARRRRDDEILIPVPRARRFFALSTLAERQEKRLDATDEDLIVKRNDVASRDDVEFGIRLLQRNRPIDFFARVRLLGILVDDVLELKRCARCRGG